LTPVVGPLDLATHRRSHPCPGPEDQGPPVLGPVGGPRARAEPSARQATPSSAAEGLGRRWARGRSPGQSKGLGNQQETAQTMQGSSETICGGPNKLGVWIFLASTSLQGPLCCRLRSSLSGRGLRPQAFLGWFVGMLEGDGAILVNIRRIFSSSGDSVY